MSDLGEVVSEIVPKWERLWDAKIYVWREQGEEEGMEVVRFLRRFDEDRKWFNLRSLKLFGKGRWIIGNS